MKVAVVSALVQFFSLSISIGETLGQQYQAWQDGGPKVGQAVQAAGRGVLYQIHQTSQFSKQGQHLDADLDAARTALHETTEEDINRSSNGRSGVNKGPYNTVSRRQEDCKNSDIAECVGLLEVLTNKDLGFAASVDELNRMCPVLLDGLQCIDNYTRRCLTPKHREYFNKLYAGTIRVIKDLCNTKGKYQQEYIRHAPCMRQVNPKYNQCSEAYHKKTADLNQINDAIVQLSEEEKNRNVITLCCSFQEYLQCSERVVYETCGNETALFTKAFLDRMAGPIVQDICQAFSFSLHLCLQESSTDAPGNFNEASTSVTEASTQITQESSHSHLLENKTLENLAGDSALQTADRDTLEPSTQLLEGQQPLLEQSKHVTTRHPHTTFTSRPQSLADPDPTSLPPSTVTFTHGTTIRPVTSLPATPVSRKGSDGGSAGVNSLMDRRATEELSKADMQYTEDETDEDLKLSASVTFKCVKYAPGSQVCENAGSSATTSHTSLLPLVPLLFSVRHLLAKDLLRP